MDVNKLFPLMNVPTLLVAHSFHYILTPVVPFEITKRHEMVINLQEE
jgi:hypothetical protein